MRVFLWCKETKPIDVLLAFFVVVVFFYRHTATGRLGLLCLQFVL